MDRSEIVPWSLLVLAGSWDSYILPRTGLAGGQTASFRLYSDSRKWPLIAFIFGVLTCWADARTGTHVGIAAWHFVMGHIFATMRGIK